MFLSPLLRNPDLENRLLSKVSYCFSQQVALLETNPYLLGLTIVVSIVHSIFEFLAFKNGKWRLAYLQLCCDDSAGVSFYHFIRRYPVLEQPSVFGGAVCAFYHIWCVSVAGGAALHTGQRDQLCCPGQRVYRPAHRLLEDHQSHGRQGEWLVTLAGILLKCFGSWYRLWLFLSQLDRENRIAGIVPRLIFKDKSTYVESSTKIYDDVSELSCAVEFNEVIAINCFWMTLVCFSRWPLSTCPGCCTLSLGVMQFIVYYMWSTKAGTLGCSVCFTGSC